MTAATSASDRYETARAILSRYDAIGPDDDPGYYDRVDIAIDALGALRALIKPPSTESDPDAIAESVIMAEFGEDWSPDRLYVMNIYELAGAAVRAGIQAAWESWEPDESAHEHGERVATRDELKQVTAIVEDIMQSVAIGHPDVAGNYIARLFKAVGVAL